MNDTFNGIDLSKFSDPAQQSLAKATREYALAVVAEAGRLEAGHNHSNASPEITATLVDDAVVVLRRNLRKPRTRKRIFALRVAASLGTLLFGAFFEPTRLSDPAYALGYAVFFVLTFLLVTAAVFTE